MTACEGAPRDHFPGRLVRPPGGGVMIGNEEDFTASLGFEVEGVDENLSALEVDKFAAMIQTAAAASGPGRPRPRTAGPSWSAAG
jgi:hypothetical protein